MPVDLSTVKTHHLEIMRYAVRSEFDRYDLKRLNIEELVIENARGLVYELHAHIAGRRISGEEIRYPATWWDAVKDRWFPRWLRRRFPPRFTVITPQMTELFPDVKPIPGQRSVVLAEFSAPRLKEWKP